MAETRLALLGDRNLEYETHRAVEHTLTLLPADVEAAWWPSDAQPPLEAADAVWVVPGSPYRDDDAVLRTIELCRTRGRPILGTCGGCQYMLLEFARNVAGLDRASHDETAPGGDQPVVAPLACSLVGQRRDVRPVPGTRLAQLVGEQPFSGFHFCSYGLNDEYRDALASAGLIISAYADDAGVEGIELPSHPFYMATLFQPQMESLSSGLLHPILGALIEAGRAARSQLSPT
jgi:CTP synthase (UTP-ammonia lyase)